MVESRAGQSILRRCVQELVETQRYQIDQAHAGQCKPAQCIDNVIALVSLVA
ncbi:hypothetical protein [Lysobacter gummosus]|uniref:hypothetical protein n=1 Tax=Lysobacter gummosus TaxID=262324 RepID=UPI0036253AEF